MRMLGRVLTSGLVIAGFAVPGLLPSEASAAQLTLVGDERMNFLGSGPSLPGTPYGTGTGGVDYDQIGTADPHPGEVLVSGTIASLNYHSTGAPTTNVNFNFTPDLAFTFEAELLNITLTPVGGSNVLLKMTFGGTIDGLPDLVVTDPFDSTVLLKADLIPGTFNGTPQAALTAQGVFNAAAPPKNVNLSFFGFFDVDPTSLYASLFADSAIGSIGFESGVASNFEIGDADGAFDFDDMAAALGNPPFIQNLISNTAEANGNVFAVTGTQFVPVPEPGTGLLLGLGLVGVAGIRRRSASRR